MNEIPKVTLSKKAFAGRLEVEGFVGDSSVISVHNRVDGELMVGSSRTLPVDFDHALLVHECMARVLSEALEIRRHGAESVPQVVSGREALDKPGLVNASLRQEMEAALSDLCGALLCSRSSTSNARQQLHLMERSRDRLKQALRMMDLAPPVPVANLSQPR